MDARTLSRVVPLLVAALLSASTASAITYVVRPDGTGDFPTIQAAIDACVDGDIVELTDGTFSGQDNRDLDYLGKAITIRSQSGSPESCVIDCDGTGAEPHRGFFFHSGETSSSILAGITVTGGLLREEPLDTGAGILCQSSSPTFTNCIIADNFAFDLGGGLACLDEASPTMVHCLFDENMAYWGAGLSCSGGSSPVLTDCEFRDNFAVFAGGGMICDGPCSPTLSNCLFKLNSIKMPYIHGGGGGVLCRDGATPSLDRCTFAWNISSEGGGVSCIESSPSLAYCTFSSNAGAALYCVGSSPDLTHCTFYRNGNRFGSSVRCDDVSSPTLENTIMASGRWSPPVFCGDAGSSPTLICCDLHDNEGGDWIGCIADQYGVNGNMSEDPLLCDPDNEDFTLREDSPCAPANSGGCGLIGAWPVGCGTTIVEPITWGAIKASLR